MATPFNRHSLHGPNKTPLCRSVCQNSNTVERGGRHIAHVTHRNALIANRQHGKNANAGNDGHRIEGGSNAAISAHECRSILRVPHQEGYGV